MTAARALVVAPALVVTRSRRGSTAWDVSAHWTASVGIPAYVGGPLIRTTEQRGVGGIRVYALTRRAARRRAGIAVLREKRVPTSVAVALLDPPS